MLLPRADFWRLWAVALALGLLAIAVFTGIDQAHALTLRASFYGSESGARTASGAVFRPERYSAAHRSWAFGTRFKVCLAGCADGIVNDRGPARWTGRDIDLSHGLARAIGLDRQGVADVRITLLDRALRHPLRLHSFGHHRRRRGRHHHD